MYFEVPKELGLPPENIMMLIRPLYGLPEAGMYWFYTYRRFYTTELGMKSSDHNLCLLFAPGLSDSTSDSRALTVVKTDNIFTVCNPSLIAVENPAYSRFESKPLQVAEFGSPFIFRGSQVILTTLRDSLEATPHLSRLSSISVNPVIPDEFIAQRTRGC